MTLSSVPVINNHGVLTFENAFLVASLLGLPFFLGVLGLMAKAALIRLSVNL